MHNARVVSDPPRGPASLTGVVDAFSALALLGAALSALPALLPSAHFMLDNLNAFAPQLLLALLPLLGLSLWKKRWKTAAVTALVAALQLVQLVPHRAPALAPASGPTVRWLVANVQIDNPDRARLAALIARERPELVGLLEPDRRWLEALAPALTDYPYRVEHPLPNHFGVALYSRLPLQDAGLGELGRSPTIIAHVRLGDRPLRLALVHPVPPVNATWAAARDDQLARIAALRPPAGGGLVVAGALNATAYSAAYRGSFGAAPFTRAGGLTGTFPAALPAPLRIAIDHALSAGPVALEQRVGPPIGSDHLPLLLRAGFR